MGLKELWKIIRKGLSQDKINGLTLIGIGGTTAGLINIAPQWIQPILFLEVVFFLILGLNQMFREKP